MAVRFPLVDTSDDNGSFKVMPATQHITHTEIHRRHNDILEASDFPNRHRVNVKKGTLYIQDPRVLHRGTTKRADHPRSELVFCYSLSWFVEVGADRGLTVRQAEFEKLSERSKHLLARCCTVV